MVYGSNNSGNDNGNDNGSGYGNDSNLEYNYTESPFKFTDPVRYYKSNDPYYWEVDNIPLKQLQENCLWLRDQIQGGSLGSGGGGGVDRININELRPYVTGSDRVVRVRPGNFIGRVNDAYGKGLNSFDTFAGPSLTTGGGAGYLPPHYILNLPNDVLHRLVGDVIGNYPTRINSNGLYDFAQYWNSTINSISNDIRYSKGSDYDETGSPDPSNEIYDIPTVKTAMWKHTNTGNSELIDLRQLSVEFTKRWGGVARTSVVNIEDQLEITIPVFKADDFMDNDESGATPLFRIDLVFVYTHPIDNTKTTIAKTSDGAAPEELTTARLGLVKGAGLILKPKGPNAGELTQGDGSLDPDKISDMAPGDYLIGEARPADSQVDKSILAPLVDQYRPEAGYDPFPSLGIKGTFPSPDDLMNLAPLLSEELESTDYALIGQSILPLCYVVTPSTALDGAEVPVIPSNVIDIRPFLRTAELTYNERAGIAAANPPLSLANQAVGSRQVQEYLRNLETVISTKYDPIITALQTVIGNIQENQNPVQPEFYSKIVNTNWPDATDLQQLGNVAFNYPPTHQTELFNTGDKIRVESNTFILQPGIYKVELAIFCFFVGDFDSGEDNEYLDVKLGLYSDPGGANTLAYRFDGTDEDQGNANINGGTTGNTSNRNVGNGCTWRLDQRDQFSNAFMTPLSGFVIAHVAEATTFQIRIHCPDDGAFDADSDVQLYSEGNFSIKRLAAFDGTATL